MKPADTKKKAESDKPDPRKREERGSQAEPENLDFATLDLTIEKVEERISPSETNVFDK